jgi:hypothetical protein
MILKNVTINEELVDNTTILSMKVPEKLDQNMQAMYDSDVILSLSVNYDGSFCFDLEAPKSLDHVISISRVQLDRISDCMDTLEDYLFNKYRNVLQTKINGSV